MDGWVDGQTGWATLVCGVCSECGVWCPWELVHSFSRMVKVVRSKSGSRSRSRSRCQGPGQGVGADAGRCLVWSKKSKVRGRGQRGMDDEESNADAEPDESTKQSLCAMAEYKSRNWQLNRV